jgi:peptidyl-dipeptidase Dcp
MKISLEHITIRTNYQDGDIGYLTWMHGQNYNFGIHFEAYVARTLADYYTQLNSERERFWVAEHNGKMIGHIALKDTDGQAQLRYFLIEANYRGIGLGQKLMTCFMDFMREVGYTSSFLTTERNLKTAVHIYGKYGYEYVSRSITGYGLEERRYELHLDK